MSKNLKNIKATFYFIAVLIIVFIGFGVWEYTGMHDIGLTDRLLTLFTYFLAVFTGLLYLSNRQLIELNAKMVATNERLAWFTGAMESHSELMMRIEAARGIKDKPIPVIWWNPEPGDREPFHTPHEHKEEAELTQIKLKVPLSQRKDK